MDKFFRDIANDEEFLPNIAARRRRWIVEHASHADAEKCLEYPYALVASLSAYLGYWNGRKWSNATQLMCTIAHGERPEDAHYVLYTCDGKEYGCINPHHMRWGTPEARAAQIKERELDR